MSTLEELRSAYLEKNTQFIIVDKKGTVKDSDNVLFKINKHDVLDDIHPFFLNLLDHLVDVLQFSCVHLKINTKSLICDVKVKSICENNSLIIISDFSSHYNSFQSLAQSRNETAIQTEITELENFILSKKEQFKTKFIANFSHEVVSPIFSILTFSNMLKKTILTGEQSQYLDIIENSTEALRVMTTDIFDISKIETGNLQIIKKKFSLKKLTKNSFTEFEPQFKQKGINFYYYYAEDMPIYVVTDKVRVRQIINNLLSNALKFTHKGSVTLTIKPVYKRARKLTFTITVVDTGIGISEENQRDIFKSFSRAKTLDNIQGTGLGLTITKELLTLLDGDISVQSKLNQGSTFTVTLRATKPLKDIPDIKETTEYKTSSPKEILLVENNTNDQLNIFKIIAQSKNYFLDIANNGYEALQLVENKTYDIILIDFKMPNLNGLETSKAIREIVKTKIPILIITGAKIDNTITKHFKDYYDGILQKPFTEESLKEQLKLLIK